MANEKIEITESAIQEAKKNPNGYVYVIDAAFKDQLDIPPSAIKGCWKVNEQGEITGEFIPNPNYLDLRT